MNVRKMAALLDRKAFVHSTDGLVPCTIRDVKVQYGTTRLEVEVHGALVSGNGVGATFTKHRVAILVDAARVYLQSAAADDLLVPAMEVWS